MLRGRLALNWLALGTNLLALAAWAKEQWKRLLISLAFAAGAREQWKRFLISLVRSRFPGPMMPALKRVHCQFGTLSLLARLRNPTNE